MSMRLPDPAVMARIKNLDLLSRRLVDGYLSGVHVSSSRGSSYNFAEYRNYVPGDDVRRIDWRLFARKKQLYVKTYDAESSAQLTVVLDCSASMDYASTSVSKFDYARIAAACLLRLADRQGDRVGLALLGMAQHQAEAAGDAPAGVHQMTRLLPRSGGYAGVMHALQAARAQRRSNDDGRNAPSANEFESAMRTLAQNLRRKGIVIVLSDFYLATDTVSRALQALRMRGQDVSAFHISDARENDFELGPLPLLQDMETGEQRAAQGGAANLDYLQNWSAHWREVESKLSGSDIAYAKFVTDQPLDRLLFAYLSERGRYRRMAVR